MEAASEKEEGERPLEYPLTPVFFSSMRVAEVRMSLEGQRVWQEETRGLEKKEREIMLMEYLLDV
jgi:hypothetical protein